MNIARHKLSDLEAAIPAGLDLFVCSASFEDRCRSVPEALDPQKAQHVLICENENHAALHGANPTILRNYFEDRARMVYLDTGDPLQTADALNAAFRAFGSMESPKILIDITAFTHESLLILLRLLPLSFPSAQIELAYTMAAEYSIGDEPKNKWLSRGVADVRPVLGYSGDFLPWRPLHLILLGGFESDRALELIRTLEPAEISLGVAESGEVGAKLDLVAKHNIDMIEAIYDRSKQFSFHPYEPLSAKEEIEKRVLAYEDMDIAVAPMNTKISTLGAALAAIHDTRIQLCYPQAVVYNYLHYSVASDDAFIVNLTPSEITPTTQGRILEA
jgi:hypothetical protein